MQLLMPLAGVLGLWFGCFVFGYYAFGMTGAAYQGWGAGIWKIGKLATTFALAAIGSWIGGRSLSQSSPEDRYPGIE